MSPNTPDPPSTQPVQAPKTNVEPTSSAAVPCSTVGRAKPPASSADDSESPAKKAKLTTNLSGPSPSGSVPKLRSAPARVVVKPEAVLASAVPAQEVVDVDAADWTNDTPMDFSKSIEDSLSRIASPPGKLSPDVEEVKPAAACSTNPVSPLPEHILSQLRSVWISCAQPVTNVSRSFLKADGHLNRVDILVFRAVDQCASGAVSDAQWGKEAANRFAEVHKGYLRVPLSLRCDRSLFERSADALYIDQMSKYLFDDTITTPPVLDSRLYKVFVTGDRTKALQHRLMWAVVIMRQKVMTNEDFFVARRSPVDVNKASVPECEEEPILTIPWDLLPTVPSWIAEAVDLRSAPMAPVRALTFFTATARDQGAQVYKKWNKALQFELAIHVTAAHYSSWARPVLDQTRIWLPSSAHINWLKQFESLPPIPIFFEALGRSEKVTIVDVVRILEDARSRAVLGQEA